MKSDVDWVGSKRTTWGPGDKKLAKLIRHVQIDVLQSLINWHSHSKIGDDLTCEINHRLRMIKK